MSDFDVLQKDKEEGESSFKIIVFVSDDYLVKISEEFYTGNYPYVYVGKYIAIEPLRPTPHNIGDASRADAVKRLLADDFVQIKAYQHDLVDVIMNYINGGKS